MVGEGGLKITRLLGAILAIVVAGPGQLYAQQVVRPRPVAARDFVIMSWGGSMSDPNQLHWMRQAGLNVSGFCKVGDLRKVSAAGLSCLVTDPRVNGYDWTHMPSERTLTKRIESLTKEIRARPAALGFFLADEPRPREFHGLGEVASILAKDAPGKLIYINLLPNYSPPDYLQTTDYGAYLLEYLDQVHPNLLSYDNYSLFDGKMLDRFYTNLETIRSRALDLNIPFWNVVLSNTHFGYMPPSPATLRLQVYASLAYGVRGIAYYTYFAPAEGNYRLAPVDQFGHRTPTWAIMRNVNSQVDGLAPWLIKLKSTGVYYSSPVPTGLKTIAESHLVREVLSQNSQNPPVAGTFLVGEFKDARGEPFLMLVNRDLVQSMQYVIHLKDKSQRLAYISPYSGKIEKLGAEMNWLAPGAGALFRLEQTPKINKPDISSKSGR